jgi:DNA-binding Lrp family transcriptional regulator
MEPMTQHLLNDYQRGFPLSPRPFALIARRLNTETDVVLDKLRLLQTNGVVSRVGPVFKANTVGSSTLATMSVPEKQIASTAAIINAFPQVNHNYEREHRYNLWFVVTAIDQTELQNTLKRIQQDTGHEVLSLPMVKDYHIDLGFSMSLESRTLPGSPACNCQPATISGNVSAQPDNAISSDLATDEAYSQEAHTESHTIDLIAAIQGGLPLVARPYLHIGERLGLTEDAVINKLRDMIDTGTIKRLGVVVRHHELGYRANAMIVWDVPGHRIDNLGHSMGDLDEVTLCYQRPRALPHWPYNLFCMIHGHDRDAVMKRIDKMVEELSLEDIDHDILFSGRRFKQRGARYRVTSRSDANHGCT